MREKEERNEAEELLWTRIGHGDKVNGEVSKENLLRMSEISIILNMYNDIFSSFDPRPYENRALSDDFLIEMKNASLDKASGAIELKLLMAKDKRDLQKETLIKRRLHDHFRKHYFIALDESKKIKRKAITMIVLGIVFMIGGVFASYLGEDKFISHLLIIILEPSGWFTFWTGLDEIYYHGREQKPELDFYEKMSHVEINFYSY